MLFSATQPNSLTLHLKLTILLPGTLAELTLETLSFDTGMHTMILFSILYGTILTIGISVTIAKTVGAFGRYYQSHRLHRNSSSQK
jgi:hypothetical protein